MTPRSLFVIIIKILGLFMLGQVLSGGYNFLANLFAYLNGGPDAFYALTWSVFPLAAYVAIFFILMFRPEYIIDKMKLDKNFYEEQFQMTMDKHLVVNMAIIVVGLYILVDSAPHLCKEIVSYYQGSVNIFYWERFNYRAQGVGFYLVKVVAAYIMLTNSEYITRFVTRKNSGGQGQ